MNLVKFCQNSKMLQVRIVGWKTGYLRTFRSIFHQSEFKSSLTLLFFFFLLSFFLIFPKSINIPDSNRLYSSIKFSLLSCLIKSIFDFVVSKFKIHFHLSCFVWFCFFSCSVEWLLRYLEWSRKPRNQEKVSLLQIF